ncbi:MAG: type II toxin-antitoxin system VapC family toxin [Legionellaceae bacterium]|nr:type II toxin-antitoxin system VapC family toxin [Legionellaceae bacterium]
MMLRYLLDTNICIYIAKQRPLTVLQRFEHLKVGEVAMSLITYGELLYGAEKSQYAKKSKEKLEELTTLIPPLPLSNEVSQHYAQIRAHLERQGKPIGNNDLWISAHAVALNTILVTNHVSEFSRVPHLKVENWV